MNQPAFRTGSEAAEKAAERGSFARTHYLSIPEDGSADIRMLTDHNWLITVAQHNNAPTRTVAADYPQGQKWPQSMGGVCRNDPAFAGMYPDGCFLCTKFAQTNDKRAYKPAQRSWGLAVEREKVIEGGRHVGMRDAMIEVDVDGQKRSIPKILVVNFAWGNFWSNFAALQQVNQTWLSTDIHISRKGKELDTSYSVAPWPSCDISGNPFSNAPGQKLFDLRDPECAAPYIEALGLKPKDFDSPGAAIQSALITLITERSSDEFYARFFDDTKPHPPQRGGGAVVPPGLDQGEGTQSANEPSPEELAALASRIMGNPGGATAPPAAAPLGFGAPS